MAREKLRSETRRRQIAKTALEIIADQGIENLSMAGIARRLGLVPSAIYRHYKNKHEIINASMNHIMKEFQENLAAAAVDSPDALDQLESFLLRQMAIVRYIRALPRIVFSSGHFTDEQSGKSVPAYSMIRANLSKIAETIKAGQKAGQISQEVDPDALSALMLGIVSSGMLLWHVSHGSFDVTRHAKKSWSILRKSLTLSSEMKGIVNNDSH